VHTAVGASRRPTGSVAAARVAIAVRSVSLEYGRGP
jgi:hypothetical protein